MEPLLELAVLAALGGGSFLSFPALLLAGVPPIGAYVGARGSKKVDPGGCAGS